MVNLIKKGDVYRHEFSFTQNDVIAFAEASGDTNPIHLNMEFAKSTIFGRTIVHGFLGASIFSKVFGTIHPGFGTIYLKQDLRFLKPIFTNEKYFAVFEVLEIIPIKNRAEIRTSIINQQSEKLIEGLALIQHPSFIEPNEN
jgi:3-hydroxybutyryl-CoA dehydratase